MKFWKDKNLMDTLNKNWWLPGIREKRGGMNSRAQRIFRAVKYSV